MILHYRRVRALHDWIGTKGDIREHETYRVLEERNENGLQLLTVDCTHGLRVIENIKNSWGNNGKYYKIPAAAFEPLQEFFLAMDRAAEDMSPDNIEKAVGDATRKERNKIYNEGVEHGRNLLFALNDGTIT